jgi:DtxR family Mn-dependent transcriptional regulator
VRDHALRIVRRHRLLEAYLHGVMGFDLREAHRRATLMQPTIDEVFEDKLDAMLGHPRFDPHGQPIPSKNATWPKVADAELLGLPAGTAGRVSRVTSEDAEAIAWLAAQGIVPGAPIVLDGLAPFDGPVALRLGGRLLHLGRRLAAAVHVAEGDAGDHPKPRRSRAARERR